MQKKQSLIGAILGFVAVISLALHEYFNAGNINLVTQANFTKDATVRNNNHLREVIAQKKGGSIVLGEARVIKVLADDREGSAHQRFIVKLDSGETLLIAHNIDLAPRVANLAENDVVSFKGEYEVNAHGGVVHWTHKDPHSAHEDGWIDYKGKRYQ